MSFKKSIILSAALLATGSVFAQNANLKKAQTNIAEYEKFRSAGNPQLGTSFINNAKTAIDLASVHEKTKDLPETWLYYSLVYANLANDNKNEEDAVKAAEGVAKAKELDKAGKNKENISIAEQQLYVFNFNQGIAAWGKEDFSSAYKSFENGLKYSPNDTTLTYYAGVAAVQIKEYKNGIDKYVQLVDRQDFSEHKNVMRTLPNLYLTVQDTVNALKYAGIGAKQYPNDKEIIDQNINYNIALGNEAGIISDIQAQLDKDPTNKVLFFYLGIAESATKNEAKALEAYKKAIAIDPKYSDANINAGVIIINAVRDKNIALNNNSKLTNNQYNEQIKLLKEEIKPAEQYFVNALEVEPKNESALKGLHTIYNFLQQEAKAKEIQARIDAL